VVGDVAGDHDEIEMGVVAEVIEHGIECRVGVVGVSALGLPIVFEEVSVGQLSDTDDR
jgi:hypothetical protein